ncbi:2OG-Fe(II) oxygenase [Sinisalibacter aestuarii]|uniref:PKHD-type hydroxylase n=1 Tax=Sinisalibacter aestuarii TaxID=2949426 RepID=A0ABQ5LTT6_9RHOB|nr:2OG-Fe(II) oxygenase [Sinisalibacter aestuarii]GKY88399.1 PKHD-type hydroxylase [Sinisalibacter aestuarii]
MNILPIPAAFSAADCARIVAAAAEAESADARLVRGDRAHNIRRADLVWLDDLDGMDWVTDRLIDLVRKANHQFHFDLDALRESPQVARYDAAREGHFDWHSDIGEGAVAARRKLTFVVQLSDPEAYEGGALELRPSLATTTADRAQGSAVAFPSFVLHRVTPVTKGTRHSLTIWAHGPAFR